MKPTATAEKLLGAVGLLRFINLFTIYQIYGIFKINMIDYLRAIVDSGAKISRFDASKKLSLLFCSGYDFFTVKIFENKFILAKPKAELSFLQMIKQQKILENKLGLCVAFELDGVSAYGMKKLIENKVAFVVKNKQMYLPFLGMSFTKSKESSEKTCKEKFTPSEQLIFLYILYSDKNEFSQSEIVNALAISAISVSRCFEHFLKLKLVSSRTEGATGRKLVYSLAHKKDFYSIGKRCLVNPVQKIFYAKNVPKKIKPIKTGISALSEATMLSNDGNFCIAITKGQENFFKKIPSEMGAEENKPRIFVMKYDASLLQKKSCTDPITTILAIDKKDDRIEIAIDALMEEYEWYKE